MKTKKVGSTGRFGPHYGLKLRNAVLDIERKQKVKQKCPSCLKPQVKRISFGIFECRSCGKKFTGKAYFIEG